MPPSQPVPLELISLILSFLDPTNSEDREALISCGLVSRAFTKESRSIAFKTVTFSSLDEWRVPILFELLDSPQCSIARHIVSLECFGTAGMFLEGVNITEPRRWQANVLVHKIVWLPSIRSLRLQSMIMDEVITPQVIQSFCQNLRRSSITLIHLELVTFKSFTYLCDIVAAIPRLESLFVKDCFFHTLEPMDNSLFDRIVPNGDHLREFLMCWSEIREEAAHLTYPNPLSWLLRHACKMPRLEKIGLHVKTTRVQLFEEVNQFLELLGPSVKDFDFLEYLTHGKDQSNNMVSLVKNTQLRTLTLPFAITPQPNLPAILKTANSSHLEVVHIKSISMNPAVTYIRLKTQVLQDLDGVLAQPNLASVKKVIFYLGMTQTAELRQSVMDAMPKATERGIIQFRPVLSCCTSHFNTVGGTWPH